MLGKRLLEQGEQEIPLPLKPEARRSLPCHTLDEIDTDALCNNMKSTDRGVFVSDSADTAFDVFGFLSKKFGQTHNLEIEASPWCSGYFLIGYEQKN